MKQKENTSLVKSDLLFQTLYTIYLPEARLALRYNRCP